MSFIIGSAIMLIFISNFPVISSHISPTGKLGFMINIPILSGINLQNIIPLILLGVLVTGFGYMFYFKAMDTTSVTTASMVFFIKPALAPIFALLILNESISINTIIGIALILIGAYFIFVKKNLKIKLKS